MRGDPGTELLMACLVPPRTDGAVARLCAAAAGITDWDAWLRLARHHRLVPLAATRLLAAGPALPAAARAELGRLLLAAAARTARLLEALRETRQRLDGIGVPSPRW